MAACITVKVSLRVPWYCRALVHMGGWMMSLGIRLLPPVKVG